MNSIGNLILNPAQIPTANLPWGELSDAERLVYGVLVTMRSNACPIDLMSVTATLQTQGLLARVGGQQVLAKWVEEAI